MKSLINQILKVIDDKLEELVKNQLTQKQAQSGRPKWTQTHNALLQPQINDYVTNLLANHIAQAPLTSSPANNQVLFKALASYSKLKTAEIVRKISPAANDNKENNNKEILNKKIFSAKILLAALLAAIYQFHEKQYRKKLFNKLLAALERSTSAGLTAAGYPPPPAPVPKPAAILFDNSNLLIAAATHPFLMLTHLHTLGLKCGANHADVKAVFAQIPKHHPHFDKASKAFSALMALNPNQLGDLAKISDQEINQLALHLEKHLKILDQDVSVPALKTAMIEFGINNAASDNPLSEMELQNMQLTLGKLEDKFGDNAQINLRKEVLGEYYPSPAALRRPLPQPR